MKEDKENDRGKVHSSSVVGEMNSPLIHPHNGACSMELQVFELFIEQSFRVSRSALSRRSSVSAGFRALVRLLSSLSNSGKEVPWAKRWSVSNRLYGRRLPKYYQSLGDINSRRVSRNILVPRLPHSFAVFNSLVKIAIDEHPRFCRKTQRKIAFPHRGRPIVTRSFWLLEMLGRRWVSMVNNESIGDPTRFVNRLVEIETIRISRLLSERDNRQIEFS